jgi:hypothetical protein
VIARAAALAALAVIAVIAAPIGAALGYAALALMAAASCERDLTKDRRRRRFTPADIRQIRRHAPQCGLAWTARRAERWSSRRWTERGGKD